MKSILLALAISVFTSAPALADLTTAARTTPTFTHAWQHLRFDISDETPAPLFNSTVSLSLVADERPATSLRIDEAAQGAVPPKAFVYSDGYTLRRRVHKYASFATGPLFLAQYIVGQKLYNGDTSSGLRSAHGALAAGVGALFAVNTVTGAWNLWEGRNDPSGRGKRVLHSILMLAADAGFLATAGSGPESEDDEGGGGEGSRRLHRNVAIISFGSASIAYVLMLLGS